MVASLMLRFSLFFVPLVIALTYSLDKPYQTGLLVITDDTYADSSLLLYPVSLYKPYALIT